MERMPFYFAAICGGFFFLILLVLGGGLIFYSLRSRKKADQSRGWPSTNGKVIASEIRESKSTDEDGRVKVSYYPHVEYAYEVNGQNYISKQISFGGVLGYNDRTKVQAKLEHYPVGSTVLAFYNPEKPAEAVVEQTSGGAKWAMVVGIIILVIASCIAIGLLVGAIRNF
jgi:hypothetical protein